MSFRTRRTRQSPRSPGRSVRAWPLAILLAAAAAPAVAAAPPGPAPRGLVLLELHASGDESQVLRETVGELCARLGLGVRERPFDGDGAAAPGELVVGEVSIDLGAAPGTVVVRAGRAVLQRSLAMEGPRPVLLESAATIAYTALEALLPRSERDAVAPAAPGGEEPLHPSGIDAVVAVGGRPAAPVRRFGMELAPLALLRVGEASLGPAWGGGLRLGAGWRRVPLEPSFSVTGSVRRSIAPAGGFPTAGPADIDTYSLRVSAGVALASGSRVALQTGPSFAIETTSSGQTAGGMPAMGANLVLRPGWEGRLVVALASSVQAFLGVGGDCALDRTASASPPTVGPPPPGGPGPGGPSPFPQGSGGQGCGFTTELGLAFTLFGAPAVRAP